MASWPYLGHHWPMRTTRYGPAMPPCTCRRPCSSTLLRCSAPGGVPSAFIRVGLHAGEVWCSIGSDLHMDYTAVGADHRIWRPAWSRCRPVPGSILITADVLGLTEGYI